MKAVLSKLLYQMEKKKNSILVSIVASSGSAPRTEGSQMLVGPFGRIYGSIGGGAIEKKSEDYALELLNKQCSDIQSFSLHPGGKTDIGMVCGGDVTVLFLFIPGADDRWKQLAEKAVSCIDDGTASSLSLYFDGRLPSLLDSHHNLIEGSIIPIQDVEHFEYHFQQSHRAIVFGAGHIAQALCPLLRSVDFVPIIYDNRPDYAKVSLFPDANQVICGDFEDIENKLDLLASDFVVVMTSGHAYDYEVEKQVHRCNVSYLGIVGSKSKRASVREKLLLDGISDEKLDSVYTPVGIAIKAVTPEEIAISIAGEMIYVRATLDVNNDSNKTCPV